jgi:hypothetical protein
VVVQCTFMEKQRMCWMALLDMWKII